MPEPANLRIVPKNDWDDAVVTATSEVADFEAVNTQNSIRDKPWRTSSGSSNSITGVLPSARTLSHFSMHWHLCLPGNVRLQLFSDTGASVGIYDSGALPILWYTATEPYLWSEGSNDPLAWRAPFVLWFPEVANVRAAKVTFTGTPPQAYWQVSRIFLGRYKEGDRSAAFGMALGLGDNTDRVRTFSGNLRTNSGDIWRTMSFDLSALDEDEVATWHDIRAYAGRSRDVVVSVYPEDGDRREALHTICGRLVSLNDIGRPTLVMTLKVQIEED